jgi:ligand-binding SRPBCC domain-containing protein
MHAHQLHRRTWLVTPVDEAFAFFCDPMNLQRITPPELDLVVDEPPEGPLCEGAEMGYRLRLWGAPFRWRTRIVDWKGGTEFVDTALTSPYRRWEHRHILVPEERGTTLLDLVDYELPLRPVGELAHFLVRRQLDRIFDYRESAIQQLFGSA